MAFAEMRSLTRLETAVSIRAHDVTQDRRSWAACHSPGASLLQLRRGAWWLHPGWTAILVVLPCLAVTSLVPDDDFRRWWRTPKYFGGGDITLIALLIGVFIIGTMVPNLTCRRGQPRTPQMIVTTTQQKVLRSAGSVFLGLTFVGYAAWAMAALSRGYGKEQLYGALNLERGVLLGARSEYFVTVPGVTTLTQFGQLALICLLLDRRISGRRHMLGLTVLAILCMARVFLNAERLALMEMAIPAIVLAATLLPKASRMQRSWMWAMIPLLAPVILATLFGVFEYTRSWNDFYARHSDTGFGGFVLRRLGGYYATASNNSAILLAHHPSSDGPPQFTVRFIWDFPIIRTFFPHSAFGSDEWSTLLLRYGNLEFTNGGGILPAIADYGMAGALIWWGIIGLLLGMCYRSLRSGELGGIIVYAVTYVGLLEMGMIFYWGLGRAFPVIVGGLVTWVLLHRARVRKG
jgi:oligosaccharide repeat unit polymerase